LDDDNAYNRYVSENSRISDQGINFDLFYNIDGTLRDLQNIAKRYYLK